MGKKVIKDALKKYNWNVSRTAEQSGILRQNSGKIRKLEIKPKKDFEFTK